MEKNIVITIARQYGSGGRTIAQMLSERLGIHYYDKELLKLASEDSGINEDLFRNADEHVKTTQLFKIAHSVYKGELIPPESDDFTSMENLFNYQAKIIKKLAEQDESCIIVGRCADHVLRDFPNKFDFFIHGSIEDRVKRVQTCGDYVIEGKTPEAALEKMDKQRSTYYNYYTGKVWGKCDHYDLCINAGRLGVEYSTDIILEYINRLKK